MLDFYSKAQGIIVQQISLDFKTWGRSNSAICLQTLILNLGRNQAFNPRDYNISSAFVFVGIFFALKLYLTKTQTLSPIIFTHELLR